MKLWSKPSQSEAHSDIERFTVGKDRELDVYMAEFDALGSIAHAQMLASVGLLEQNEFEELRRELRRICRSARNGEFQIEEGVEDVHSQIELLLTRALGETGKKIHSGRSRNDQALLDIKLFVRSEIRRATESVRALFDRLLALGEAHKNVLMPGYTHFQIAMPSSFGLWFGAYAESLADDVVMLRAAYGIADKNPLGSAAGYGSSFPLNRRMTTELLGFEDLNYNAAYAQMARGKTERAAAQALASVAATLAKLAADVTLFMSQNFGFVSFPDELTTGSSIMPHKKNPDVFELLRARCNRLQALPGDITLVTANLPSGYHRDFQLLKELLFPAFEELRLCLSVADFALSQIRVNPRILDDEKYAYLFSVEAVNAKTLAGVPFRDAYREVGEDIAAGRFRPPTELRHTHEGSIGNLCYDDVRRLMREALAEFRFERAEAALAALAGEDAE